MVESGVLPQLPCICWYTCLAGRGRGWAGGPAGDVVKSLQGYGSTGVVVVRYIDRAQKTALFLGRHCPQAGVQMALAALLHALPEQPARPVQACQQARPGLAWPASQNRGAGGGRHVQLTARAEEAR